MSAYDYGNARLRAMKSRLLTRAELNVLAGVETLDGLITSLSKTSYRKPIEAALARSSGMNCVVEALRSDFVQTMGKVKTFYSDQAQEIVILALRAYDIHNLKAILSGVARNALTADILSTLLPIGDLDYGLCLELVRGSGLHEVIDLLASMSFSISEPLLHLRKERPEAEISEMELVLDQWYFQEIKHVLPAEDSGELFLLALNLEADLINLITVLRFVSMPEEKKLLHKWLGSDDLKRLFVGPGSLAYNLLAQAGSQETPEGAVEILANTSYGPVLHAGLVDFHRSGRLSDFEKHLQRFRLGWMYRCIARDPLGFGVFLGYLALKVNEIHNLTWIAQGIQSGLKVDAIRAELEVLG